MHMASRLGRLAKRATTKNTATSRSTCHHSMNVGEVYRKHVNRLHYRFVPYVKELFRVQFSSKRQCLQSFNTDLKRGWAYQQS